MREELRHALRSLRESRAFTFVAVGVLTLAIGAGTAIFSVVDAAVLRGLPFGEHDRLVAILEHDTKRPTTFGSGSTTPQMFVDWRAQQQSFEAITAAGTTTLPFTNEAGEPAEARGCGSRTSSSASCASRRSSAARSPGVTRFSASTASCS